MQFDWGSKKKKRVLRAIFSRKMSSVGSTSFLIRFWARKIKVRCLNLRVITSKAVTNLPKLSSLIESLLGALTSLAFIFFLITRSRRDEEDQAEKTTRE